MGDKTDRGVCYCCGQARPFPTQEGLWEYLENPIFLPDGSLDECRHNSRWIKASVINAAPFTGDNGFCHDEGDDKVSLRLVPVGMWRCIEWPAVAIWRKISDIPEIATGDVIDEGYRLKDGEWMGKWDDESEAAFDRLFRMGR